MSGRVDLSRSPPAMALLPFRTKIAFSMVASKSILSDN